ncbi:MAG: tRNA (adenosine(37)-N6)-threonylcarbamoyltransferase complex dimerization subunit type 1 TsaB [Spirochaetaceae bacterium]|nr:tRNA (adenosine(37)-N6)-threonylcarbamoyltransferase complex dimerization subunit type 1 TsaB [Spirochaetaceae bacterium]
MNVLAIDAASALLSVALKTDSGFAEASLDLGLKHAERLTDLIDFCLGRAGLAPADLDLLACSAGPGSFTGLRIGMATAKGMALALGKPLVAVPTLDCLAWGREAFPGAVAPILDGKKGRVYAAIYERGKRVGDWLDVPLARLAALLDTYPEALITGPDAGLFEELATERSGFSIDRRGRDPAARALAELALERFARLGPSAPDEGPLYLRPSEAEEAAAPGPADKPDLPDPAR